MNSIFSWNTADTPPPLAQALALLGGEYALAADGSGDRHLNFRQNLEPGSLHIRSEPGGYRIEYGATSDALRGVAQALAGRYIDETTCFQSLGIMLDCSRNAVMTVTHLKKWLRRLALLGYNMVMLYTEDTYELPGEPFFGHMRGAYTAAEIRELDQYAASLGIELRACIQTLAHLAQILKWQHYAPISDTPQIMLVDDSKTYNLIEKMIEFWSSNLHSSRIHIGMDEAHNLGRGKFLDHHSPEPQFDIFNRHLERVSRICEKYALKPMIWSDMYFRMGSARSDYYDRQSVIPDKVKN
ncbi:MAG: beta-N-acetylhexosaminidase, partial [Lentisphaerae bacterium]|nr:beta-N-acetylhexosaminidase [Lentisphaerota bacterium]